ncbi:unnamed protein product [Brassicogethes aeneus]|uniref:Uncharacterized protein n=1 Tax=Brassicogethes aeneus TaxID=1431903 RepID=A0A9P0B2P5_BRAAE|nr:unnamed protein product [Brassicogethes aeneus]
MKNKTDVWESSLQQCFGIVITPDEPIMKLKGFDVIQIDFWIYANTYGIYMEEIVVNFADIPSFCFSLLVEIVGLPIEFPFALNMTTQFPTIRFGNIPYKWKPIKRKLKVVNSSEIPIAVCFHVFLPNFKDNKYRPFNLIFDMKNEIVNIDDVELFLVHNKLGKETSEYLQLTPCDLNLEKHSFKEIELCMYSDKIPAIKEKTDLTCYILAYIYLNEDDRMKLNFYYRKSGKHLRNIKIDVLATIELPTFKLDYLYGDTKLQFFVNDIIYEDKSHIDFRLVFQNNNCSAINTTLHIMEPFDVISVSTSDGVEGKDTIFVNPGKTLIVCYLQTN